MPETPLWVDLADDPTFADKLRMEAGDDDAHFGLLWNEQLRAAQALESPTDERIVDAWQTSRRALSAYLSAKAQKDNRGN